VYFSLFLLMLKLAAFINGRLLYTVKYVSLVTVTCHTYYWKYFILHWILDM